MHTIKIKNLSSDIKNKIITIRRDIHKHPELGFKEHRTASLISGHLVKSGFKVRKNICGTGVTGLIEGKTPGKTIAVRADMDALPVTEKSKSDYASVYNGIMHACGHDAHVAIALGAAEILSSFKDSISGGIKFIFQPAEESLGGAKFMIEEGVLENPRVDAIIALHVSPGLSTGRISIGTGAVMASPSEFEIIISGKGGHAAEPHKTIDPILVGTTIVNLLQNIIPKQLSPFTNALLSVTCFQSGNTFNVTPKEALIKGTVRTFDRDTDTKICKAMESVISSVTGSMGAKYSFRYNPGYPPVINNEKIVNQVIHSSSKIIGSENIIKNPPPAMLAEDFAYYAQIIPGALLHLGCAHPSSKSFHNLHSSSFDIDEDCIALGMEILSECVLDYLNNK